MNLIVNADKNWGIGKNNELLVHIPNDMKMFRNTTIGKVVVMGRKTLESFPNGLPLVKRTNIVMTKNKDYDVKGAVIVHSKEELLEELKKYPQRRYLCHRGRKYLPYALCHTAVRLTSQGQITLMMRIRISQIWMRWKNGSLQKREKKKLTSILSIDLQNTKNCKQQLTSEKKSLIIYSIKYK